MPLKLCVPGMSYEMRLVLQGIYEWKDFGVARKLFGNWCAWVRAMRQQTGGVARADGPSGPDNRRYLDGILAH